MCGSSFAENPEEPDKFRRALSAIVSVKRAHAGEKPTCEDRMMGMLPMTGGSRNQYAWTCANGYSLAARSSDVRFESFSMMCRKSV